MSILKILVILCFKIKNYLQYETTCLLANSVSITRCQSVPPFICSLQPRCPAGNAQLEVTRLQTQMGDVTVATPTCYTVYVLHKYINIYCWLLDFIITYHLTTVYYSCQSTLICQAKTVPVFMMHHKLLGAAYILDVEVILLISLRCNCIRFNFPSLNPVYVVHLLKQLSFHHLQTYCSCCA